MTKVVLLSFDVEEFDLPIEFNINFPKEDQFDFSFEGLKKILEILDKHDVSTTFFVTAIFASKYSSIIREISRKHEIASHGLNHQIREYTKREVKESKEIIEKKIKKKINGFRAPRFHKIDFNSIYKLGFKYDSSICPTYLPKRYNNYFEKRKVFIWINILVQIR